MPEELMAAGEGRLLPESAERLNKKLLIVDDDAAVVEALSRTLKKAGYTRIDAAGGGAEALTRIRSDKPDLILLDVRLPDMSGYEVIDLL